VGVVKSWVCRLRFLQGFIFACLNVIFFSREILNEPSLTPFHVSNQFDTFFDAFKFTIIAYLRAQLTAAIYVNSNYSSVCT